jgi:molybdopterin/thiamine biosynthesis adenylyltransferase
MERTHSSSVSWTSIRFHSQPFLPGNPDDEDVQARYRLVPGADPAALAAAHIVLVGCGGLNGEVGHGLVRKGVGWLTLLDHDLVEFSNLARQMFGPDDLGQNKALALARNLARQATGRTLFEGQGRSFQDALEHGVNVDGTITVVGVDNNATRVITAQHYLARHIPVLFLAVDATASRGYVFVQTSQPGHPCFLCLYPDAGEDRRVYGCAGASIEILKVVAGIALYAVDSLLMPRPRPWNYKEVVLNGGPDGARTIAVRPGCRLCGG